MIEITVGMYDPQGGESLPFTGCFWNGWGNGLGNGYRNGYPYPGQRVVFEAARSLKTYCKASEDEKGVKIGQNSEKTGPRNGYPNRYLNRSGKQEQEQKKSKSSTSARSRRETAASEQPKMKEVA